MPKVYNITHANVPPHAVYIGRLRGDKPSRWGNRFIIGIHGDRDTVICLHRESLTPEDIADIKRELRGRDLVCFCAPLPCHGNTYLEIANGE